MCQVQSHASPSAICGEQSGTGTGFSLSTSVFLPASLHQFLTPGIHTFSKNKGDLKILATARNTRSKFPNAAPQTLGTTTQNLISTATRISEFVHTFIHIYSHISNIQNLTALLK